jgi:hypothetical protein
MKEATKQPTKTGTQGLTVNLNDLGGVWSIKEKGANSRHLSKSATSRICFPGFSKQSS